MAQRAGRAPPGQVRIIGGSWRGMRLPVPDRPGLRPTPDRVRETVFNWLRPVIAGADCLDLYAGSGVLGIESVSQGAGSATLVDVDPAAVRALQVQAARFAPARITVHAGDALAFLRAGTRPHDIVFVDPPYLSKLLAPSLALLAVSGAARRGTYGVFELGAEGEGALGSRWRVRKRTRAGTVHCVLAELIDASDERDDHHAAG